MHAKLSNFAVSQNHCDTSKMGSDSNVTRQTKAHQEEDDEDEDYYYDDYAELMGERSWSL
jgi:hypothetical protein